jgi:hypothetical protein
MAAAFSSETWFILAGRIATLLVVVVAWVFFRANDLDSARRVLAGMINFGGEEPISYIKDIQPGLLPLLTTSPWIWIIALLVIAWLAPNSQEIISAADRLVGRYIEKTKLSKWQTVPIFLSFISFLTSMLVFVITVSVVRDAESPFIYFNF